MPLAITLKAMNRTADLIRQLWGEVALFEDEPSMLHLNYPPHVSLAVYDGVAPPGLPRGMQELFRDVVSLKLSFRGLRSFDVDPLVVWAEPLPSTELDRLHAALHALVDPALCRPHYRPGTWVPHCTLGTNIRRDRRSEAIAYAANSDAAFDVIFDVADWVSFPPVAVIAELSLATAAVDAKPTAAC